MTLLLCHIPGSTTFESLRTLPGGAIADTFQEACRLKGLLADDLEWSRCLAEAATYQTRTATFREIFVTILRYCDVVNPVRLWEAHRDTLSEDFLHQACKRDGARQMDSDLQNLALLHIDRCLRAGGSYVGEYHLPTSIDPAPHGISQEIVEELAGHDHDQLRQLHETNLAQFTQEQHNTYDEIMATHATLCDEDDGRRRVLAAHEARRGVFFIDRPGGTGKTFHYTTHLAAIRARGKIALAVASSGVASTLLPRARTAHSLFMIPININRDSFCFVQKQSSRAQLLRKAGIICWDEAPMAHRHCHEAVERCLTDIMDNRLPWGGKIVVVGGEFRQVLPVVRRRTKAQVVNACVNHSPLWGGVRVLRLPIIMRVLRAGIDDIYLRQFCEWKMKIGNGTEQDVLGHSRNAFDADTVQVPDDVIVAGEIPRDLMDEIFPDLDAFGPNGSHEAKVALTRRSVVVPRNDDQRRLNDDIMQRVPAEEFESLSIDSTQDMDSAVVYPVEFLYTLTPAGMPTHRVALKVGAPFILLRTINPATCLFNGRRCLLLGASPRVLHVEIATGPNAGRRALMPRCTFTSSEGELPFVVSRRQFPVAPCFAMTMNKAHRQTLDKVGIHLRRPVFSHGQLYVAVSRATSPRNLRFMIIGGGAEFPDGTKPISTSNYVYIEVLNTADRR